MKITIKHYNNTAYIDHTFTWKSENKLFRKWLNFQKKNSEFNSPSYPNPELEEAKNVCKLYNMEIVSIELEQWDIDNPREKGVIY